MVSTLCGFINRLFLSLGGMLWGATMVTLVAFRGNRGTMEGPALDVNVEDGDVATVVTEIRGHCRGALLFTVAYFVVHCNLCGAARYARNIVNNDHSFVVFLVSFWMYVLLVDYGASASWLGRLYLGQRLVLVPLVSAWRGACRKDNSKYDENDNESEDLWVEALAHTVGYSVLGVLWSGVVVNVYTGQSYAWMGLVSFFPTYVPFGTACLGSLAMVPGLPLGPLVWFLRYVVHWAVHPIVHFRYFTFSQTSTKTSTKATPTSITEKKDE